MVNSQKWDVANALDEFKELISYSLRDVSVIPKINEFLESGESSFIITKVDRSVAELAGKDRIVYKLADRLEVLLTACRTKNIEANKTQIRLSHGESPSDSHMMPT